MLIYMVKDWNKEVVEYTLKKALSPWAASWPLSAID